jgi:hypothetical protein
MKFIVVAVLLIVGILWMRSRAAPGAEQKADQAYLKRKLREKKRQSAAIAHNPYAAVSIRPGKGACAAAKALQERRFLPSEAPITPLADCNSPHCECRYVHYADRRAGEDDRRSISVAGSDAYARAGKPERRQTRPPGRRAADREEWGLPA